MVKLSPFLVSWFPYPKHSDNNNYFYKVWKWNQLLYIKHLEQIMTHRTPDVGVFIMTAIATTDDSVTLYCHTGPHLLQLGQRNFLKDPDGKYCRICGPEAKLPII